MRFCFKSEIFVLRTAGSTGLRGQERDVFLLTLAGLERLRGGDPNYGLLELNPELDFQRDASFPGLDSLGLLII